MHLLESLNKYLLLWGIPGLLVIAFLDSAAVPMLGGPDAVILLLAWRHPDKALLIVLAAVVGSMLGNVVLYRLGRVGGEMALARFSSEKKAWVKRKLDHNAFAAIVAAVAAPPPFPTKLVVLAAGAFGISQVRVVNGVFAGRLLRYSVLAYLGARFGDQAAGVFKEHYSSIAVLIIGAVILLALLRYGRSQAKDAKKHY
jgi:membrane protein YqaA with SNARE-associated domain